MSEWTAKGFTIYYKETGLRVACVDDKGYLKETAERNTRLIANAPEMYETLRRLFTNINYFSDVVKVATDARKLVASIDGEQEAQS